MKKGLRTRLARAPAGVPLAFAAMAALAMPAAASAAAPAARTATRPASALRQYTGRYRLTPHRVFNVTVQDGRLRVQLTGTPPVTVHARGHDEFFSNAAHAGISFKRGAGGKVDALVLHQHGQSARAPRIGAATAAPPATAVQALDARLDHESRCLTAHPVHVKAPGGELYGVLTVPAGAKKAPGILLIPGNGPVDLNGDAPPVMTNHIYKQLAYALTCRGYAVLRYDKRGIARSTGDPRAVTLQSYRSDALALAAALRHRPGVDPHALILMGHSLGGLIATFAAPKLDGALRAVVLLEAPGVTMDKLVTRQTLRRARAEGASKQQLARLESKAGEFFQALRESKGHTFKAPKDLQGFPLVQMFAPVAGLVRSEMAVHPARRIARLKVPALIVQGGADIQIGTGNAKRLHAADPGSTLVTLPHMTHELIVAHGKPVDSARPQPGSPLDPALVRRVAGWLDGVVKPAH